MILNAIVYYNIFVLFYFMVLNFSYLVLFLLSAERLFYYKRRRQIQLCKEQDCAFAPASNLPLDYKDGETLEGFFRSIKPHYRETPSPVGYKVSICRERNCTLVPSIPSMSGEYALITKAKDCALLPSIAVLAPAYNEEETISESVLAFLELDYPELEIIVINDGSTDKTLEVLRDKFGLFEAHRAVEEKICTQNVKTVYHSALDERLIVIDKENGGKSDALNAGLNYSRSRLFCAVDADSLIERNALKKLVQPYLERDAKVVALGGTIWVANGCKVENGEVTDVRLSKKLLPAFQAMEYVRAFLCGRIGWSRINSLIVISGAFGLFERKPVIECGGYRLGTVGEDMDLVVRLHKSMCDRGKRYKTVYIPEPVCWTQVPDSFKALSRQRNRWQRGLIETVTYNWKMIGNPKYGVVGMLGMPFFFIFEFLGPIVEISGYFVVTASYLVGWLNIQFMAFFLVLAIVFGVFLSLFSLVLEEFTVRKYEKLGDKLRLFLIAVIENFGYRQINSWWRMKATIDFIRKKKAWGEMERKAFTSDD